MNLFYSKCTSSTPLSIRISTLSGGREGSMVVSFSGRVGAGGAGGLGLSEVTLGLDPLHPMFQLINASQKSSYVATHHAVFLNLCCLNTDTKQSCDV